MALNKFNKFYFLTAVAEHGFYFRVFVTCMLALNSASAFSAAGVSINNTANIEFIYQSAPLILESSPTGNNVVGVGNGTATSFLEDRLINFSVVSIDATELSVVALQSGAALTFSVTNNGNAPQDFLLTAINTSPSPFAANVDSFDPVSPMQIFVENGSNAGYLATEDTGIFIDELAVGATAIVYLVATMPAVIIGDAAAVALIAQVAEAGAVGQGVAIVNDDNGFTSPAGSYSNGAVNISTGVANTIANTSALETVFNDPAAINPEDVDSSATLDARANGQHSDVGVFLVLTTATASVTLDKTVTVIDTLGGTDPHAGAALRYQIDVVITGIGNVNNLVISDLIPANTTYVPSSIQLNGVAQTDASDAPSDYSEFNGSGIVVDLSQGGTISVAPATANVIVFDVTIN